MYLNVKSCRHTHTVLARSTFLGGILGGVNGGEGALKTQAALCEPEVARRPTPCLAE